MKEATKEPRKAIKKVIKLMTIFIGMVLILPIIAALLLLLNPVQNRVVDWATEFVSKEIGHDVSIGSIYIKPYTGIVINQALLLDYRKDTLIYAGMVDVDLNAFRLSANAFSVEQATLDSAYFNLRTYKGDTLSNLAHFISNLPKSADTAKGMGVVIGSDRLVLHNAKLQIDNANNPFAKDERIDFAHLLVRNIDAHLTGVNVIGDSVSACIDSLSLVEKSGFLVRHLSAEAAVHDGNVHCKNLTLLTNKGVVKGDYEMLSDDWTGYANFLEEVKLRADLYQSDIQFDDIAYFTPKLRGFLTPLQFTGHVYGTISNLRADVDELRFENSGYLKGRIKVRGLPDVEGTFIDANLEQLYATFEDASHINLPKDGGFIQLNFPENIRRMQYVDFIGSFTGFPSDFVTTGNIETALGTVDADVNVKVGEELSYSGKLSTAGFKLGPLIEAQDLVGDIAMNLHVKGRGVEINTLEVNAVGEVQQISVLNYNYRDIEVDGKFSDRVFSGYMAIADSNVNLEFNGDMDFNGKIPKLTATCDIKRLFPFALNLMPADTFGVYKGLVSIDLKGGTIKEMHGDLALKNAAYLSKTNKLEIEYLNIKDRLISKGHNIEIESDFVQAKIIGRTSLLEAPWAFLHVGHTYLPSFIPAVSAQNSTDTLQDFMFELEVENNPDLLGLISKDLTLANPLHINGSLQMRNELFEVKTDSLSLSYGDVKLEHSTLEVFPDSSDLIVKVFVANAELKEDYSIQRLSSISRVRRDSLLINTNWHGESNLSDSGEITLVLYRDDFMPWNVQIKDMHFQVSGTSWSSERKALISADTNKVIVRDLRFASENGLIQGDGVVNKSKPSELNLMLRNFNLGYLSDFAIIEQELKGIVNGIVDVGYINSHLTLDGQIDVDTLFFDGVEVGHIEGEAKYESARDRIGINANINYQGNETVKIWGDYYPKREQEQLDLEAGFTGFKVETFQPFLGEVMDNMSGAIDGSLTIAGNIDKPIINGGLILNEFSGRIVYLNTTYRLPIGLVKVQPDMITMDYQKLLDENDSRAFATVQVMHDNFRSISYDIFLQDAKNFLCLNTTEGDNQGFYGTAYINGEVNIGGYAAHTYIEVNAETDKNTNISIPLDGGGDVSEFDYINFVDTNRFNAEYASQTFQNETKGLELDFNLSVDKDAMVQIIFDEKVGDIIKVRGNGDMLMRIDNKGKFNMYGDYVISSGDYLFTLQNIVNKRFEVESGSKLTWNGEVDEARLDLTAIYKLKASPAPMVEAMTTAPGGVDDVYHQRLPTDVKLLMNGPLSAPEITFDVELTSLPETDIANQLLASTVASKEQITSQAFSLLIAQRFSPGNGRVAIGGAGQSSGFEVLSNQLSNWASQYSDEFDVGISYDSYTDEYGQEGTETELSLSRNFFNDRVEVEVNGSVQSNSTAEDESQTNNLAGEFNVEYKVNEDGSLVARVYNESNTQSAANLNNSPYTQGVGIQYRKEFDTWGQFFKQLFTRKENN